MTTGESQRYRFGPLERRGVIGSLRPAQVTLIAASLTGGVILMRTRAASVSFRRSRRAARGRVLFLADQRAGCRGMASIVAATPRGTCSDVKSSVRPPAGRDKARGGRAAGADSHSPEVGREIELLAPFQGETIGVLKDRRAHSYGDAGRE